MRGGACRTSSLWRGVRSLVAAKKKTWAAERVGTGGVGCVCESASASVMYSYLGRPRCVVLAKEADADAANERMQLSWKAVQGVSIFL